MKKSLICSILTSVALIAASVSGAIITVNTENNSDFSVGKTNLWLAITMANTNGSSSNVIQFNIPGSGVHFIQTPAFAQYPTPGGYPYITNANLIIDGYSQPGATPNTNSIHSPNNAQIKIVLDSRNGGRTPLNYTNLDGIVAKSGFGSDESAVLGIFDATNVWIKGVSILPIIGSGTVDDPVCYGIGIARDYAGTSDGWHISGCWIGVAPDGTTVSETAVCIEPVRHRDAAGNNQVIVHHGTIGVSKNSTNPRAEFNVILGGIYLYNAETEGDRICGNFWGVLPDGLHDYNMEMAEPAIESGEDATQLEIGRDESNTVIGTDGDGVNDADEGNVFGGNGDPTQVGPNAGSHFYFYSSPATNIVVAGNYFGVGIDGLTRFTNASSLFGDPLQGGTFRIGSDFDGVSDALEANLIYNNYPFSTFYTNPPASVMPDFFTQASGDNGARFSLRGNKLVNNNLSPYSYADGSFLREPAFTNYEGFFMDTNSGVIPILSTNSSAGDIIGTCALTNGGSYSNIIIDVYVLDPEGWTNGKLFVLNELSDFNTYTNGFPQGKTYLGSFVDNGPFDRDPAVGSFNFNAGPLGIATGTQITITANYSADPPGMHNARTHTSNFSTPLTLRAPLRITSFTRTGTTLTISWSGGAAPYTLQKKTSLTGSWANVTSGISGTSTTDTMSGTPAFYRVLGN